MAVADIETLLNPVPGTDPCGADLEYDPAFTTLDKAAQGKQATGRFGRTKDLRVAVHLAKALLRTDGLRGFAEGLTVVDRLLQAYWDGVYPRLDPDDDNDPTMRLNILAMLAAPEILSAL